MNVEALRRVVLDQAAEEAARAVQAAERHRLESVAKARSGADSVVEGGRSAGEADGRAEAARQAVAARRRARSRLLAARRGLYEQLQRQSLAAAQEFRAQSAYPALVERLERAARAELGDDAVIELDPGGLGGLIARAGPRMVDYSLPALVGRCVEALGVSVEELWR
jgi:hypothetical protein